MLDRGLLKWRFNSIVEPTIRFLTILNNSKIFVALTVTTVVTFILLMKRISIITLVMYGEHLVKVIGNSKIKGVNADEYLAS
jgi:hypothetical protein